jgi:hypothetical protein
LLVRRAISAADKLTATLIHFTTRKCFFRAFTFFPRVYRGLRVEEKWNCRNPQYGASPSDQIKSQSSWPLLVVMAEQTHR